MSDSRGSTFFVGVVAHTDRVVMACELASSVEADETFLDDGFLGEWRNHVRALRRAEQFEVDYAVILQDDAVPVAGFRKAIEQAVEVYPNSLISLYVGTHRPRPNNVKTAIAQADKVGAAWLTADTLMWGVGIIVPTSLISEILDQVKGSKLPYDQRIGLWAEETGNDVYYTWPSLVDHADEPTVIAGRSKEQGRRVAHRVGIPDWNSKTVRIDRPDKFIASSIKDRKTP